MDGGTAAVTAKGKAKSKGNKKDEKDKNPKGKVAKAKGKEIVLNYAKFEGQGLSYKAKLFGFVEVPGPRGDQSSVQAIQKLKQQAKQLKKGANEHKLKITFNITLQGVRLFNEKTQTIEHEHPIHKISFISHDPDDRHVFAYIYSPPRSAANEARKYYLFAIKSDKFADVITVQLYELFQVVYKMQENKKMKSKDDTADKSKQHDKTSRPLEPLQNKMLLEMSNKIGGDQQHYPPEEHLYAEPTFVKHAPAEKAADLEYAVPSDTPVPVSSGNESNEYKVPRQENVSGDNDDLTTGFALSLRTNDSESSHALSDNVSTRTSNDDSGFEAVFDSTFPTEETSNRSTFHAEFPPFENGLENEKSPQDVPELSNGSEKCSVPGFDEVSPSNQISFDAFGDFSSNADDNTAIETPQNEVGNVNNEQDLCCSNRVDVVANSVGKEDVNFNSATCELQPAEKEDVKEISPTIGNVLSLESERKSGSDAKNNKIEMATFVPQTFFEVNFESEQEDVRTSTQNEKDMFSFGASSDAFPSQDAFSSPDPFASDTPTEVNQPAFGTFTDDDPFSPRGGSNTETKSDPFAENENPFTSDFSSVNSFEESKEDMSDQTNSQNDEQSESSKEDIFEEIFEAKMEGECEDKVVNGNENEIDQKALNLQDSVDLEKLSSEVNTELDFQEKEVTPTPREDQHVMTLPNVDTSEVVEVQVSDEPSSVNNESLSDQQKEAGSDGPASREGNLGEMNTFDFSSSDVYVTLKTAASPTNRPLSPNEFSPPPLPPRPATVIPKEPHETITGPKIPPALPPRPSLQPSSTEPTIRKPPELPPRIDLEENGSVENELMENLPDTETHDTESPMFQTSFDTFNFDNVENNSPVIGSPTSGFESSDLFKDPFAGADPFQTPSVGDPFASSFHRDTQQDNDNFDPFSGDDPFAISPAFDAKTSFSSSFDTNLSSNNEPSNDDEKDKFADFSSAFT